MNAGASTFDDGTSDALCQLMSTAFSGQLKIKSSAKTYLCGKEIVRMGVTSLPRMLCAA